MNNSLQIILIIVAFILLTNMYSSKKIEKMEDIDPNTSCSSIYQGNNRYENIKDQEKKLEKVYDDCISIGCSFDMKTDSCRDMRCSDYNLNEYKTFDDLKDKSDKKILEAVGEDCNYNPNCEFNNNKCSEKITAPAPAPAPNA